MKPTGYMIHAEEGENKGEALARELHRFLLEVHEMDRRTIKYRDLCNALECTVEVRECLEKHNGFRL